MSRGWSLLVAAAVFALATAAHAGAPPPARVSISQFAFQPARITVPAGATVTWTNADSEEHTVTATDRSYSSAALERTETFSHRFTAPGTYTYFCALHPHMTATVVVR